MNEWLLQIKQSDKNNNRQVLTLSCVFVIRAWSLEHQASHVYLPWTSQIRHLHTNLAFQMQEKELLSCGRSITLMGTRCLGYRDAPRSSLLLWCLSPVWESSWSFLLQIFILPCSFLLFWPHASPSLFLGIWASVLLFLLFFPFPPRKFLLTCLQVHRFFPWMCQVN